jgi:hypothetical protein
MSSVQWDMNHLINSGIYQKNTEHTKGCFCFLISFFLLFAFTNLQQTIKLNIYLRSV